MQSWTQPKRNDDTEKNVVSVERFRHHVSWVGGNALAYRPLLETAVLMDSIPMVDVVAEVAKGSLSSVSQPTYQDAFGMRGSLQMEPVGGMVCSVSYGDILFTEHRVHRICYGRSVGLPWAETLTRENADALLNFYRGSTFYYYKGFIPLAWIVIQWCIMKGSRLISLIMK